MAKNNVDAMILDIQDFLAFGPASSSSSESPDGIQVSDISRSCSLLQRQWDDRTAHETSLERRLKEALVKCEQRADVLAASEILAKYSHLCTLEVKYQLIGLHRTLVALQNCGATAEIPQRVADIVAAAPAVLPAESTMYKLLSATTASFSEKLIKQFEVDFEEHLREAGDNPHSQKMWCSFLEDSKVPVVSFILMNMLPVALSGLGSVVESFENSFDKALTPMWSRLHFHLTMAREEGTIKQLMWSFQYAKKFVDTLSALGFSVLDDSLVIQLVSTSSDAIDMGFILKKISRFMRAHVAVFMEVLSPHSAQTVLQTVESALELDAMLRMKGLDSLYVSEVVCEYKPALLLWLDADRNYAMDRLRSVCPQGRDDTVAYASRFKRSFPSLKKIPGGQNSDVNCFRCVYEVCWLLMHVFRLRYSFLPLQCGDDVVDQVIEPTLCAALGLVLYRIRSHRVLVALSKNRVPIGIGHDIEQAITTPVVEVIDSVKYFLECLSLLSSEKTFSNTKCLPERFEQKWKRMRHQLSAHSMLISSQEPGTSIASSVDVISFAFASAPSSYNANDNRAPDTCGTLKPMISLTTILAFCDQQMRLICRGLVEEYQDVATVHKFTSLLP